MKRTLVLTAMFVVSTIANATGIQIVQTAISPVNGHAYDLLSPSNWTDAESYAESLGGHLATIRNQAENDWVTQTFDGASNGVDFGGGFTYARYLWIGLNDAAQPGNWVWASGEPVTYTNWEPGEPNFQVADSGAVSIGSGPLGEVEHYVQIGYGHDPSNWNDLWNYSQWYGGGGVFSLQGVVEIVPASVPEPSTALLGLTAAGCVLARGVAKKLLRRPTGR